MADDQDKRTVSPDDALSAWQRVQAKAPRVHTAQAILCIVGVTLLVTLDWSRELTLSSAGIELTNAASFIANLTAVAVLAVCVFLRTRLEACLLRPSGLRLLVVLAALAGAGRLLATFCFALNLPEWAGYVGVVLYSVSEPVLLLSWLAACCRNVARAAALVFPAAYALAAAAFFVLRAMSPWVASVLGVVLPLAVVGVYAVYLLRRSDVEPDEASAFLHADPVAADEAPAAEAVAVQAGRATDTAGQPTSWSFPVRPVALMTVYSFVFYFSLAFSHGPNPYGSLGMLLVSLGALGAALAFPRRYTPAALYKLALPLMVAGLLFLGFLTDGRSIATLLTNSANIAFTLFMLITLCEMCAHYGISPVWTFGLVYAFSRGIGMLGLPLGQAFIDAFAVGSEPANLAMCVVVVGVVVLSTVFFNDRVVAKSFGMVPAKTEGNAGGPHDAMSYSERVVWQCAQTARTHSLTQREQEVLELMVQGVSMAEIAQKVCVSYGTVKTHVNHIYRKLGVHAREEAVALVTAQR